MSNYKTYLIAIFKKGWRYIWGLGNCILNVWPNVGKKNLLKLVVNSLFDNDLPINVLLGSFSG